MTGPWMLGPDLTRFRVGHCVFALDGELWVIDDNDGSTERLDAATNRWVRGPHMALTRIDEIRNFAVAVFRGQLWLVGGRDPYLAVARCHYLDTASNTWMAGPPLNTPRFAHSLAVLDGELWAVGGQDGLRFLRSCERLDATTNVWVVGGALYMPPTESLTVF